MGNNQSRNKNLKEEKIRKKQSVDKQSKRKHSEIEINLAKSLIVPRDDELKTFILESIEGENKDPYISIKPREIFEIEIHWKTNDNESYEGMHCEPEMLLHLNYFPKPGKKLVQLPKSYDIENNRFRFDIRKMGTYIVSARKKSIKQNALPRNLKICVSSKSEISHVNITQKFNVFQKSQIKKYDKELIKKYMLPTTIFIDGDYHFPVECYDEYGNNIKQKKNVSSLLDLSYKSTSIPLFTCSDRMRLRFHSKNFAGISIVNVVREKENILNQLMVVYKKETYDALYQEICDVKKDEIIIQLENCKYKVSQDNKRRSKKKRRSTIMKQVNKLIISKYQIKLNFKSINVVHPLYALKMNICIDDRQPYLLLTPTFKEINGYKDCLKEEIKLKLPNMDDYGRALIFFNKFLQIQQKNSFEGLLTTMYKNFDENDLFKLQHQAGLETYDLVKTINDLIKKDINQLNTIISINNPFNPFESNLEEIFKKFSFHRTRLLKLFNKYYLPHLQKLFSLIQINNGQEIVPLLDFIFNVYDHILNTDKVESYKGFLENLFTFSVHCFGIHAQVYHQKHLENRLVQHYIPYFNEYKTFMSIIRHVPFDDAYLNQLALDFYDIFHYNFNILKGEITLLPLGYGGMKAPIYEFPSYAQQVNIFQPDLLLDEEYSVFEVQWLNTKILKLNGLMVRILFLFEEKDYMSVQFISDSVFVHNLKPQLDHNKLSFILRLFVKSNVLILEGNGFYTIQQNVNLIYQTDLISEYIHYFKRNSNKKK